MSATSLAVPDRNQVLALAQVDDNYIVQLYKLYWDPNKMEPQQEPGRNELAIFAQYCAANSMDPLAKDVYFIKDKRGKVHYQISIDGLRSRAEASGELDGMLGPFWMGKDGKWEDYWIDDGPPMAAKVGLLRKGCREPFWGFARFASFCQSTNPLSNWKKMPEVMIAKCAMSQAYRAGFPKNCAKLYIPEEMPSEVIDGQVIDDIPNKPPARYAPPVVTPEAASSASVEPSSEPNRPEETPKASGWGPDRPVGKEHRTSGLFGGKILGSVEEQPEPVADEPTSETCEFDPDSIEPATSEEIEAAWKVWKAAHGQDQDSCNKLKFEVGVKSMQHATKADINKIYAYLAAF